MYYLVVEAYVESGECRILEWKAGVMTRTLLVMNEASSLCLLDTKYFDAGLELGERKQMREREREYV